MTHRKLPLLAGLATFLWCMLWLIGLPASTLGLPGILSMQGTSGVLESLDATSLPIRGVPLLILVPCAPALATCLLIWLAMWIDRDVGAFDAIRWALSSTRFNGICLLVFVTGLIATIALPDWPLWIISIPVLLVMPFVLLNPALLRQPEPSLQPGFYWPGLTTLLSALLILLFNAALEYVVSSLSAHQTRASLPTMSLLIIVENLLLWMLLGRWLRLRGLALDIRSLRTLLAQTLAMTLFYVTALIPLVVLGAMQVFVFPQYHAWSESSGHQLPWFMQAMAAGNSVDYFFLIQLPLSAIWMLAIGRLRVLLDSSSVRDDTPHSVTQTNSPSR